MQYQAVIGSWPASGWPEPCRTGRVARSRSPWRSRRHSAPFRKRPHEQELKTQGESSGNSPEASTIRSGHPVLRSSDRQAVAPAQPVVDEPTRLRQFTAAILAAPAACLHQDAGRWRVAAPFDAGGGLPGGAAPRAWPSRMVRLPAGTFLMGSPEEEPERLDCEGPQHQVKCWAASSWARHRSPRPSGGWWRVGSSWSAI